jgi:putative salt-induced outer membrane protein YdiY
MNRVCVLLLLSGWSARSAAQTPAPADSFKLTFDLGYVNTAGNTDVTTVNFGENLSYQTGPWTLAHQLAVVEGRSQGQETAAQYATSARVDRAFSARLGAYALGGYDRNVFAGIARRFQQGAGLTVKVIAAPLDVLNAEGGISFIQQRSTGNVSDNFAAGRGAVLYKHAFTGSAFAQQTVELLANLRQADDRRLNSETALVAPLSKHVAVKVAYAIHFDQQPEPGFQKTDRVFTTGIQIAL